MTNQEIRLYIDRRVKALDETAAANPTGSVNRIEALARSVELLVLLALMDGRPMPEGFLPE